jgi:DNA-binding MarR family transcriptional regulator
MWRAMASRNTGNQWLSDYIPYRLYRVSNKLSARLQSRLKATKLSPSKWRVLSVLRAHGTLSLSDIVEYTLMGQPTVSRVVTRLEKDGQVSRRLSRRDSRIVRVTLTEKGMRTFAAVIPTALLHQEIAVRGITKRDLNTLVRVLKRIERNVEL